jgi:hypothetical protein
MAVKREILLSYLERNGRETGTAKALYNFTGASGVLVYNNLYPVSDHHISGQIDGLYTPGISIGESDVLETTAAHTGDFVQFDTSGLLQVGSGIDFEEWTALFSLRQALPQAIDYSKQKVLLSSSHNASGISGFNFGIANNRVFYSYPHTDGLNPGDPLYGNSIKTSLNKEELAEKSVVSVSRSTGFNADLNYIEISVHDFIDQKVSTKRIQAQDRHSNHWFMGDFYQTLPPYEVYYQGFDGFINDFILVSGSLSESDRDDLSKVFFASGYNKEGVTAQTVSFTKVTGYSSIDHNAITGSGITGYDFEKITEISTYDTDNTPSSVSLYSNLPKTGLQTGRKRQFVTGIATGSTIEYTPQEEQTFFDCGLISGYSKNNIITKQVLDSDDVLEVYSYLDCGEDKYLSMIPKIIARDGGVTSESNIYLIDEAYTGENLNIYKNGVLQSEASRNLLVSGVTVTGGRLNYESGPGGYITGILDLGVEDGIRSGQTYYVDFSEDYLQNENGQPMTNSMGALTGLKDQIKHEWDAGTGVYGSNGLIYTSGLITAQRDGLLLVHTISGSERLPDWEYNGAGTGYARLSTTVKLDYVGDYEMQNTSEIVSSGKFKTDDEIMYDKFNSGRKAYYVWNNQADTLRYNGSGIDNKMYFNNYYLNLTGYASVDSNINSDVYFNGQKMTSGVNYDIYNDILNSSGRVIRFDMKSLDGAVGLFSFSPSVSGMGSFNRFTGEGASSLDAGFGLMNEQVWVNGVRTTEYDKASDFSKRTFGIKLKAKTVPQYTDLGSAGAVGIE